MASDKFNVEFNPGRIQAMSQEDHALAHGLYRPACLYDLERCVGLDELKLTIHSINRCGWTIVSMTQYEDVYTILFRRPANA